MVLKLMLGIHKNPIARIQSWIRSHRIAAVVIATAGLLLVAAVVVWAVVYRSPQPAPVAKSTPVPSVPPKPKYYSPLTGKEVPDEATTKRAVTAIMIENSPAARPQSGLKDAGVVYEAIAEGGITRFLALYQEDKPKLIGPVRSVRLYFVDWVAPFQASVAHVGGSLFALRELRNGTYRDIDEFFNGASYWRATDRYAPHNVYTNFKRLDALNKRKGYTTSKFTSWPRQEGKAAAEPNATKINVTISSPVYNNHYRYDATTNTYTRYVGGAKHLDREAGVIKPSVVIVMDTQMSLVFEDGYREHIKTTGSGRVRVFQNGTVISGKWKKANRSSQISFVDKNGDPIVLNRGQTWITAVPANQSGKVTWK